MDRFNVYIDTSGAAFEPAPGYELARILRSIANQIEAQPDPTARGANWSMYQTIFDRTGHDVGRWAIKDSRQHPGCGPAKG